MASDVAERMRSDWNKLAREDAYYYVAFGRRNQEDDEFFATARDQVRALEKEMRRLAPGPVRARRALEIGCGPGRLMRPMSSRFGEIHGVDVSDEMVRLAREKLAGVPHAHVHHAADSTLAAFADESFDFVYSYAVFQHIPSRDVVFGYLEEARRVLKPGGVLQCQINGLPETAPHYDTWRGVRISAEAIRDFARRERLRLMGLEGSLTQYMWVTLVKPAGQAPVESAGPTRIRRVTNASSSEPLAPVSGRFAALSLWLEGLAKDCDLNRMSVTIGGVPADVFYIGHPEPDGLQQVNVYLPAGLPTGLQRAVLTVDDKPVAVAATRLIRPGPPVPRVVLVSDGIDLLSGTRILTGFVKVEIEEVERPEDFAAFINGEPARQLEVFCKDPRLPSYEFNFAVPENVEPGEGRISLRLGHRHLGDVLVEIVSVQ